MKKTSILYFFLFQLLVSFAGNNYHFTVATDSTGDFNSIQEAINATKAFPPQRLTIFVKNGIYNEKVKVHSWNTDLSIIGESAENTIITFDDYFDKINLGRNSTFHTWTMLVEAPNFIAKNLTIANTAGPVGQAIALQVEADQCVFCNIRVLGHQDALYAAGINCRQYYKDCYIEGTTDFIFGSATALFENCTINSKSNSYITAASTPQGYEFGYVFMNCKFTASNGVDSVYLGRPWRKFAKTVIINCELGNHIVPEGWKAWDNADELFSTYYAEYNNSGAGAKTEKRAVWSHQLTPIEAADYQTETILNTRQQIKKAMWYIQ